ncbi:hypothetical protein BJ508DRAFT_356794 [Ascobolus immersus RN42]|uniref:Uncharacterized protein n=1 Tax=Ascobolus immersus RN42 TaxID=1160509 RepID=A0A3N4IP99_ASCIM|nr:hypothetical protein BJ508DRAFT_356794 [Ascobolus immersus RN42]
MSDGYYKYRCKNFYSHNCNNWVWMNNTVCAACIAAGREDAIDCSSATVELGSHVVSTVIDDHLCLNPRCIDDSNTFCVATEHAKVSMDIDITAGTRGLGDLFEPEPYCS